MSCQYLPQSHYKLVEAQLFEAQLLTNNNHLKANFYAFPTPGLVSSKLLSPKPLYLLTSASPDASQPPRPPAGPFLGPRPPQTLPPPPPAPPPERTPLQRRPSRGTGLSVDGGSEQAFPAGAAALPRPAAAGASCPVTHHSDARIAAAPSGAMEGGEAAGRCPPQRGAEGRPAGGQHGRGRWERAAERGRRGGGAGSRARPQRERAGRAATGGRCALGSAGGGGRPLEAGRAGPRSLPHLV